MNPIKTFGVTALAASGLLLMACGGGKVVVLPGSAQAASPATVTPAPPSQTVYTTIPATPAPPTETAVSPSPGANYVYVAGYYNWLGDHYQWIPGAWMQAPQPSATWVAAHWEPNGAGYQWVPAHWQ